MSWSVVRLTFIEMAADQRGMSQVSTLINQMLGFIPNIVVAMVILGVGAFLGQILAGLVRGAAAESDLGDANLLARLTYGGTLAFAIIMALNELNVTPVVVNSLFIGVVTAIALALASHWSGRARRGGALRREVDAYRGAQTCLRQP